MFDQELYFDDAMAGLPVAIRVQAASVPSRKTLSRSVFIGLEWGDGIPATIETYVPREQVKKLIKALKEALDEG